MTYLSYQLHSYLLSDISHFVLFFKCLLELSLKTLTKSGNRSASTMARYVWRKRQRKRAECLNSEEDSGNFGGLEDIGVHHSVCAAPSDPRGAEACSQRSH